MTLRSPAVKETSLALKKKNLPFFPFMGLWHPVSAEYLPKKKHF